MSAWSTTTRGRVAALVAGLLVAVVAAAAFRQPPGPPGSGDRVVLYGDSLAVEAGAVFVEAMAASSEAEVEVRAIPGIAICDLLDRMRADAGGASPPAVAVLLFAGNNATPCVQGPDGPLREGELAARYDADARAAVELFAAHDVRVVIAGPPPAPGLPGQATELVDDGYERLVTEWAGIDIGRLRYAPAGATVVGDDGTYADRLPCRDDEAAAEGCEGGRITVRSADRIHFCPVELDGLACPVYSSGARRVGDEMARVATQALDPSY